MLEADKRRAHERVFFSSIFHSYRASVCALCVAHILLREFNLYVLLSLFRVALRGTMPYLCYDVVGVINAARTRITIARTFERDTMLYAPI